MIADRFGRRFVLRLRYVDTIDEFGEDCLGSSHGATRPVTVQSVMVFCAFHDGDVNGREEFAMAEKVPETG